MPPNTVKIVNRLLRYILLLCLSVPLAHGAWLLVRLFVSDQFVIPTSSMSPTLEPGDRVVVGKLLMGARIYRRLDFDPAGQQLDSWRTRGLRPLRHNDIVVFNFPHHDGQINFVINNVYCKRVVAVPGDSLSIIDGHYRNNNYAGVLGLEDAQLQLEHTPDSLLWQPSLAAIPFHEKFGWTIRNLGPMYIPRKGDVMAVTPWEATLYNMPLAWETGSPITCNWATGEVWAGGEPLIRHRWMHDYYFMAGDNVSDSNDSRYWGLVPEEYVVGVVTHITYSIDPRSGKRRKGRTLKDVRCMM